MTIHSEPKPNCKHKKRQLNKTRKRNELIKCLLNIIATFFIL
jgi:hypothetical protein